MKRLVLALVAGAVLLGALPAWSQLMTVTGKYRVVEIDKENHRLGVALHEADPDKVQNWVYIDLGTEIVQRIQGDDGWKKDVEVSPTDLFKTVKKGDLMQVHGGRDWDGSINAKKIWM